jgi:hypothetical protein
MPLVPDPYSTSGGLVDADDPFFHLFPSRGGWIVEQNGEYIGHVKKLKKGWVLGPAWATGRQKQLLDRACNLLDARANDGNHLKESGDRTMETRNRRGVGESTEGVEITIPTMGWEQIDGDMDPGAHGGTIARSDGHTIELLKIQPVREYVGDDEARDVGFPFWTREASFDQSDLDPGEKDVQSAMQSIGIDADYLRDITPTQRALTLASALLDYGRAEEGPAGWSKDIIHEPVKWQYGDVAGAEYLADEDEAFRNEVLGYDNIRAALEAKVERMANQSSAAGWSTIGDAMLEDLTEAGFDAESAVAVAEFGEELAVNGDIETSLTLAGVEGDLEKDGYELTNLGGDIPSDEAEVSTEHVVRAVTNDLGRSEEDVEAAAKGLDWWGELVTWSTSGYGSVWAKKKGATNGSTVIVTVRNERGDVLHTETKSAINAGIRASEAAVREIARAEHTHYEGARPTSTKSDGFHVDHYTRRWTSSNGRVAVVTIEVERPGATSNEVRQQRSDFRVAYLGAGARRTHLEGAFPFDEAVRQLKRLKRVGRTAWIEDGAGNFVPVEGALKRPPSLGASERRAPPFSRPPHSRPRTTPRRRR